jgi:Cd2+/Zn2+-exporting ATPase
LLGRFVFHVDFLNFQLLPGDKFHQVGSLKQPARKHWFGLFRPKVLSCGNGINDVPALGVKDIGVTMGEVAALAMEMSDVTVMDSKYTKLVCVINMGTRVMYTVQIILRLACKLVVCLSHLAGYMALLYAIASGVRVMMLVTLNGKKLLPGETGDTLQ